MRCPYCQSRQTAATGRCYAAPWGPRWSVGGCQEWPPVSAPHASGQREQLLQPASTVLWSHRSGPAVEPPGPACSWTRTCTPCGTCTPVHRCSHIDSSFQWVMMNVWVMERYGHGTTHSPPQMQSHWQFIPVSYDECASYGKTWTWDNSQSSIDAVTLTVYSSELRWMCELWKDMDMGQLTVLYLFKSQQNTCGQSNLLHNIIICCS